jgi:ubiquinone/menaquinone biosynthesis C-methylase UbiE
LTNGVHLAYCSAPVKQHKQNNRPAKTGSTDWSPVADWYDQLVGEAGSEYHREVVLPGVMRLLAPAPGQQILDVACGQGVLARLLFARGATVTGVDASAELIASARKWNESLKPAPAANVPEYHIGDARKLEFLPQAHFDAAACVLAIQNIQPIQPVFAGAARALKMGGRFVIAMMHPCFRGAKETSWGWDDARKVQYRRVDRYLLPRKSPIVAHPGAKTNEYTWTFHRPLEAYVKALRNAGLLVDALEEWPSHKTSTSGPRAAAENHARNEIPMFCAIRAIRIESAIAEKQELC